MDFSAADGLLQYYLLRKILMYNRDSESIRIEIIVLLSIMIVNELTVFASLTVRFSSEGFVKCCALRNA